MKRLRKWALRLFPPVLLCLAFAGPAQAQTEQRYPTIGEAWHCVDGYSQRWARQWPSELIVNEGSGAVPEKAYTQRIRRDGLEYFMWMPMWRQYHINDGAPNPPIYNQRVWVYSWIFEGSIRCSKQKQKVYTSSGPSIYNPDWLG